MKEPVAKMSNKISHRYDPKTETTKPTTSAAMLPLKSNTLNAREITKKIRRIAIDIPILSTVNITYHPLSWSFCSGGMFSISIPGIPTRFDETSPISL